MIKPLSCLPIFFCAGHSRSSIIRQALRLQRMLLSQRHLPLLAFKRIDISNYVPCICILKRFSFLIESLLARLESFLQSFLLLVFHSFVSICDWFTLFHSCVRNEILLSQILNLLNLLFGGPFFNLRSRAGRKLAFSFADCVREITG